MAVTQKRLYGNDNAPNTLTTAYTVPTATSTIVTCITITNKTASPVGVTILLNGVTLTSSSAVLGAYATSVLQLSNALSATETIQVQASAASSVALIISGVEVS